MCNKFNLFHCCASQKSTHCFLFNNNLSSAICSTYTDSNSECSNGYLEILKSPTLISGYESSNCSFRINFSLSVLWNTVFILAHLPIDTNTHVVTEYHDPIFVTYNDPAPSYKHAFSIAEARMHPQFIIAGLKKFLPRGEDFFVCLDLFNNMVILSHYRGLIHFFYR